MRNTTITSTISSVANRVIDVVTVAGSLRKFLHHFLMRESLGYWRALCLSRFALQDCQPGYPTANLAAAKPGGKCRFGQLIAVPVVCSTPSRLMSTGATYRD